MFIITYYLFIYTAAPFLLQSDNMLQCQSSIFVVIICAKNERSVAVSLTVFFRGVGRNSRKGGLVHSAHVQGIV